MKNIKCQVVTEFLIFVGIGFIVAIIIISILSNETKEFYNNKEDILVKDLALKVQSEINLAATVEDGYLREFEIPEKLDSINYTIFIKNETLIVQSKNSIYFARIPNITGTIVKGVNKINNFENVIYINQ